MTICRPKEPKVPPFRCGGRRPGVHGTPGPPQDCLAGPFFYQHPRRPTLDGPAHNVRLHYLYVCGTPHAAGYLAPHRAANVAFLFIGLAGLPEPRTLRATPRLAHPPTLPKSASGLSGAPHAAGYLAPHRAANAAFFLYWPSGPTGTAQPSGNPAPFPAAHAAKIGLAGLTAPLAPREPPHPPPPPTLLFSLLALADLPERRTLAGNLAPRPAAHVKFFFIGPAGLPAPPTFRATPHLPNTKPPPMAWGAVCVFLFSGVSFPVLSASRPGDQVSSSSSGVV